jgi:hypothetical protein
MALRFSAAIKTSRPGAVGVWKKIASGAKQEHPERNTEQILCKPLARATELSRWRREDYHRERRSGHHWRIAPRSVFPSFPPR